MHYPPGLGEAMAKVTAKKNNDPARPNLLVKREASGIEDFPYAPGATLERIYHTYSDGKIVSIERFKGSDGYVRVAAIELDDSNFGVLIRHLFISNGGEK
jgi:hypothetical protein